MSWATIRDGVVTALSGISGLVEHDTAKAYYADSTVAIVLPGDPLLEPGGHAGKTDVTFVVRVKVSRATADDAQNALDGYVWPSGSSSIVAAIYATPTLGGAVDDTQFMRVERYGATQEFALTGGPMEQDTGSWQADVVFRAKA